MRRAAQATSLNAAEIRRQMRALDMAIDAMLAGLSERRDRLCFRIRADRANTQEGSLIG